MSRRGENDDVKTSRTGGDSVIDLGGGVNQARLTFCPIGRDNLAQLGQPCNQTASQTPSGCCRNE